jgi:hypothetical protein
VASLSFAGGLTNGRFQRILVIARHPGEGPLTGFSEESMTTRSTILSKSSRVPGA